MALSNVQICRGHRITLCVLQLVHCILTIQILMPSIKGSVNQEELAQMTFKNSSSTFDSGSAHNGIFPWPNKLTRLPIVRGQVSVHQGPVGIKMGAGKLLKMSDYC